MNTIRDYVRLVLLTEMGQLEKGRLTVGQILGMLDSSTLVFFDTETTGFDPRKDHIMVTQIAAVAIDGGTGEVLDKYTDRAKLTPGALDRKAWEDEKISSGKWKGTRSRSISDLMSFTGHDPEGVGYKEEAELLSGFSEWMEKQLGRGKPVTMTAHNAKFDMHQINAGLEEYDLPKISTQNIKVFNTLAFVNKYLKPVLQDMEKSGDPAAKAIIDALTSNGRWSPNVGNLGRAFDVGTTGSHTAIGDAMQLSGVLDAMRKFLKDNPRNFPPPGMKQPRKRPPAP